MFSPEAKFVVHKTCEISLDGGKPEMSLVEDAYQEAVAAMSPAEKIARMCALNAWGRWNIARIITDEVGPLPPEVLKWRVALRVYGHNPECRKLIEEQLARVSD